MGLLIIKRMGSFEDPSNTSQTIVGEEMIEELITEARLTAEEEVEGSKNYKRRRPSEKDRDKEDEEDLPESKKVKKSPEKIKTRKRGRPSGKDRDKEDKEDIPESKKVKKAPRKRINLKKNKENKENVYSVRRSTFGKLSGRMWVKRNPIYYRSQSAGVAMLVSRRRGNEGD